MNRLTAATLALIAGATAAPAATLTATPTFANTEFSGFQISYTDRNGNGLLDPTEMTGFTGVEQSEFSIYPTQQFILLNLPAIAGIANAGSPFGFSYPSDSWVFTADQANFQPQTIASVDSWTYSVTATPGPIDPGPAPVPLPASVLLLGSAAAALSAGRVRRAAAVPGTGA
jgi:hypothetical protein